MSLSWHAPIIHNPLEKKAQIVCHSQEFYKWMVTILFHVLLCITVYRQVTKGKKTCISVAVML